MKTSFCWTLFFSAPTSIYKQVYSCEHDQNLWYRIQQYGGKYSYPKKKLTVFEFFPIDFNHIETSLFTLFQVELKEENSKHALFRLMPRYKVKAEGDVVRLFTMGNSHAVI